MRALGPVRRPPQAIVPPPNEAEPIDPRSPEGVATARDVIGRRPDFEPPQLARAFTPWLALVLVAALSAAAAADVALSAEPEHSQDGVLRVHWNAGEPVVLEEARDADFTDAREVYRGADRAAVLTGREDGTYHYRLYALDGSTPIAEAVTVTVEHHPLPRAFAFFGIGFTVFVCTTTLVLSDPDPVREPEQEERA